MKPEGHDPYCDEATCPVCFPQASERELAMRPEAVKLIGHYEAGLTMLGELIDALQAIDQETPADPLLPRARAAKSDPMRERELS